ncbi:hypothetical protein O181_003372 [Austropuccinia psidii MF-1]|uniref:Uncharacterized protein n=1 Tax=Austropuccinia psidii MF-1 TaxID=1389203 RepID=A0A9Q3BE96_9BASI|nr:hypothetical protein [Austropuccinia psidii MF-1]
MDQVLQLHQLLKDLFQWSMDNKRFNLASHWEDLGASFWKICLKEIPLKDFMVITKGWNPTRKFRLLEERETRIRQYLSYRRTSEPKRAYSYSFRLTRSRPTQLSSGFTTFRHQQISVQESPFFIIPGSFKEKTRIQGKKQDLFQSKAERVRPNDPEAV